jgi:hypothetical protein
MNIDPINESDWLRTGRWGFDSHVQDDPHVRLAFCPKWTGANDGRCMKFNEHSPPFGADLYLHAPIRLQEVETKNRDKYTFYIFTSLF